MSISRTSDSLVTNNMSLKNFEESPNFFNDNVKKMLHKHFTSGAVFFGSLPFSQILAKKITDDPEKAKQLSFVGSSLAQAAGEVVQDNQARNVKQLSNKFLFEGMKATAFNIPYFFFLEKATEAVEKGNPHVTYQEKLANGGVLGFVSGVAASPVLYPFSVLQQLNSLNDKTTKTVLKTLNAIVRNDLAQVIKQPTWKALVTAVAKNRLPYGLYGAALGVGFVVFKSISNDPPKTAPNKDLN